MSVCPCDLLIVMAKHGLTGNCKRLNGIVVSEGMRVICGIKTWSPLYWPIAIVEMTVEM